MSVSFHTANFCNSNINKQNKVSKNPSFGKFPTPETIERDRQIKATNRLTMITGAGIGAIIGCLKFANKVKAGLLGGVIGLAVGKLVGFVMHPYRISDKNA